jgi:hypothetical protein
MTGTKICGPTKDDVAKFMRVIAAELNKQSGFMKYLQQLDNCKDALIGMVFAAIVITIVYVGLLKCIVAPLLYISIFLIGALFLLLAAFLFIAKDKFAERECAEGKTCNLSELAADLKDLDVEALKKIKTKPPTSYNENPNYFMCYYGSIFTLLLGIIYMIVICCWWKSI